MKQVVVSSGNMYYGEGERSWNIIRLKQDFIKEFPQLKNRRFHTKYRVVIFHSYDLLEKEIKDIVDNKRPMPVLLFLEQEVNV